MFTPSPFLPASATTSHVSAIGKQWKFTCCGVCSPSTGFKSFPGFDQTYPFFPDMFLVLGLDSCLAVEGKDGLEDFPHPF